MRALACASLILLAAACGGSSADKGAAPAPKGPSDSVLALAKDMWEVGLREWPTDATFIGDRRYDAELPDLSEAAYASRREQRQGFTRRLDALDVGTSAQDRITADVIRFQLASEAEREVCAREQWDVDPLAGWQASLTEIGTYQIIDSPRAAADYVTRISRLPQLFEQHTDNLRRGLEAGRTAPKSVVQRVLEQLDGMVAMAKESSPFLGAVDKAKGLPADEPARLRAEVIALHAVAVQPAWTRYRDFLRKEYLPKARDTVGVSANPDGAACYAALARAFTSTDKQPAEIHQLGLAEMARLHGLMDEVARAQGFATRQAYAAALKADKAQYLGDRDALLAHNEKIVARAWAALPKAFGRLPKGPPLMKAIETFRENESPAAYYYSASDDGSRPAYYYLNTGKPETRPLYNMEALAFHEGVPGHHLQIALAQELRDLPDLRRHNQTTAFVEGWGLYAELLADELGLYTSPATRFGMLNYQAWRAGRLVVDTGMHALGWSRDQALAYMKENVPSLPEHEVKNEIDRYITWPGQALAYMVGRMELQRLRADAEKRLGSRFSMKDFHDRLLENGALPLAVLGRILDAWVSGIAGAPASVDTSRAAPLGTAPDRRRAWLPTASAKS